MASDPSDRRASISHEENATCSPTVTVTPDLTLAATPDLLSCYGSGCSTPEAQVEASLAYRGTERYGGKARQLRKMKAQLSKHGKRSDDEEEEEGDVELAAGSSDSENEGGKEGKGGTGGTDKGEMGGARSFYIFADHTVGNTGKSRDDELDGKRKRLGVTMEELIINDGCVEKVEVTPCTSQEKASKNTVEVVVPSTSQEKVSEKKVATIMVPQIQEGDPEKQIEEKKAERLLRSKSQEMLPKEQIETDLATNQKPAEEDAIVSEEPMRQSGNEKSEAASHSGEEEKRRGTKEQEGVVMAAVETAAVGTVEDEGNAEEGNMIEEDNTGEREVSIGALSAYQFTIGDHAAVKRNKENCVQTDVDGPELKKLLRNADLLDYDALKALVKKLRDILLDEDSDDERGQKVEKVNEVKGGEEVVGMVKAPAPLDEILPETNKPEPVKDEESSDSDEDLRAIKSSFVVPSHPEETDEDAPDQLSNTYSGITLKAAMKKRRTSSAHAFGGRRGSILPKGGNIIQQFQKQGAEQEPVQAEILKYVGERTEQIEVQPDIEQRSSERLALINGSSGGACQFCGKPVSSAGGAYCCPEMEYFLKLSSFRDDSTEPVGELIDINHNPADSKLKKAARQRAAERDRQRDATRQRQQQTQNMFAFVKQMKTVQFSLASPKCMEEGWAIRPRSPLLEPLDAEGSHITVEVNSTLLHTAGELVERTYENGSPFLTLFPDGTGCCYYPSGNVAVLVSSPQRNRYSYIVQTDESYDDLGYDGGLLAFFEPNGDSVCYYNNNYTEQKIHTFINVHGGMELDTKGRRKKRWQWYQIRGHVHTPPFHPLCFSLNKYLAVRIHNQQNIVLTFSFGVHHVRFSVGAQVKVATCGRGGNFKGDPSEQHIGVMRRKINALLGSMHGAVRLPRSAGTFATPRQRRRGMLAKKVHPVVWKPLNEIPLKKGKLPVIIT